MSSFLKQGCTGERVRKVQDALNQRMLWPLNTMTNPPMARLDPDGIFGGLTDAMVREFQRLHRITVDGVVGPVTRHHLFPYIAFEAKLRGHGLFTGSGRSTYRPVAPTSQATVFKPVVASPAPVFHLVSDKGAEGGDDGEEEGDGFSFDLDVDSDLESKYTLRPWPPKFGPAEQTLTISGIKLRLFNRIEITGELDGSKTLNPVRDGKWQWEGSTKLSLLPLPIFGRKATLSPFVQVSPTSETPIAVGLDAGLTLTKILRFSVGGQVAAGHDSELGKALGGTKLDGSAHFKLEVSF